MRAWTGGGGALVDLGKGKAKAVESTREGQTRGRTPRKVTVRLAGVEGSPRLGRVGGSPEEGPPPAATTRWIDDDVPLAVMELLDQFLKILHPGHRLRIRTPALALMQEVQWESSWPTGFSPTTSVIVLQSPGNCNFLSNRASPRVDFRN